MKKIVTLLAILAVVLSPAALAADFDELQGVRISGNTATDGTGTDQVALSDAQGHLQIDVLSGGGGQEYSEDVATPGTIVAPSLLLQRDDVLGGLTPIEGDWAAPRVNANGAVWTIHDGDISIVDGGNSITVDNATLSVVGGGTEATALRVTIANDSTGLLSVDDNGGSLTVDGTVAATQSGAWSVTNLANSGVDIGDVTINNASGGAAVNIQDGGNSITVDGSVSISEPTTSSNEVHDYDTAAAVVKDATDNHDYTVTGTTFFLESFTCAGSGAVKCELQTGPVASLATDLVAFTSASNPTVTRRFNPPIEVPVTSTGTVRLIRTNRSNQAQDLYSTIEGFDI